MTHPYPPIPFPPVVLLTDSASDVVVADDSAPVDGDEMLDAPAYLEGAPLVTDTMHTVGTWIWPAAATDRLRRLGALPVPAFAAHIRDAGRDPAPVGAGTLHRALADLVRTQVAPG